MKGINAGDLIWGGILAGLAVLLAVPKTRNLFLFVTQAHPFLIGFFKFFILATMGELLAIRIIKGAWITPAGFIWRAIVWGLIGMLIVLIFDIYAAGMQAAFQKGLIPGGGVLIVGAFLTSAMLNLTFAPTFMAFHRITDTYIDLLSGRSKAWPTLAEVNSRIDWNNFISFVVLKTLPFFWIPAHTITFLLPPVYRVLTAAALSIALGAILATAKRKAAVV